MGRCGSPGDMRDICWCGTFLLPELILAGGEWRVWQSSAVPTDYWLPTFSIFSKQTEIVVGCLSQKPSNIELLLAGKEQWMINIVIWRQSARDWEGIISFISIRWRPWASGLQSLQNRYSSQSSSVGWGLTGRRVGACLLFNLWDISSNLVSF